jgi:hypothetical protein
MDLTPRQRERLISYCMWREKSPTRKDLLKRIIPGLVGYTVLVISASLGILFGVLMNQVTVAIMSVLLLGFFAGLACATITHVMLTLEMWPLVEEITDWDRVEELKRHLPVA